LDAAAETGGYTPGMLGVDERKLMFHLAKDYLDGSGTVIDLGAFCGGSATTFAAGLDRNPLCAETKIHSYDLFVADSDYMVSFADNWMPQKVVKGDSFEPIFREVTAPHADRIVVHAGDLMQQRWNGDPIELLFVDAGKTEALSGHIIEEFFPALIPGRSIVLHQDFHHSATFWLAVQMDALMPYFSIVEGQADFSAAFRLERAIPPRLLREVAAYRFSFRQEAAALRRFQKRLGPAGWPLPMHACVAATSRQKKLPVLPEFSAEQRGATIFAGNAAFLKDYCGVAI